MRQTYSEEEADEILRRAARGSSRISRDELLATAAELGIDARALATAEASVNAERRIAEKLKHHRMITRRDFFAHLAIYILVNGGLALIDLLENGRFDFVMFPMIGWGIGLAIHAYHALVLGGEPDKSIDLISTTEDEEPDRVGRLRAMDSMAMEARADDHVSASR